MRDEPRVTTPLHESVTSAPTVRLVVDLRDLEDHPLHALRLLVVADVKRRLVEEIQGGRAFVTVVGLPGARTPLTAAAHALGVREASQATLVADVATVSPGTPCEIALRPQKGPDGGPADVLAGQTWGIANVTGRSVDGDLPLSELIENRDDPLSLRLAFLRLPCSTPIALSLARLHRADETLERWRFKVAGWERRPRAAAPLGSIEAMVNALEADLDTGAVLRSLHHMEVDHALPSGSKYAAFLCLDRVLALDLGRLVGRPHI